MEEKTIVRCMERRQWRDWLAEHFRTEKEAWFVFPTAASGEKGVSYNDAVEEALCFGWIDGKALTLDASHHLRRFTPRRKGSAYSRPNIERLIRLDREGLIHPEVRASVEELIREPFVYPEDILDAVRRDADFSQGIMFDAVVHSAKPPFEGGEWRVAIVGGRHVDAVGLHLYIINRCNVEDGGPGLYLGRRFLLKGYGVRTIGLTF